MNHQHTYDENGKQTCCNLEDKINAQPAHVHSDDDEHDHSSESNLGLFLLPSISLLLLLSAIILDNYCSTSFFKDWVRLAWYVAAYLPVGIPVMKDAIKALKKGEVFTEFLLMGIATLGAFYIGEYPEGVAVMLFYSIGEVFQTIAVKRAKSNIKKMLDQRPDTATVIEGAKVFTKKASEVVVGETLQLKPGDKLALDGILLSENGTFNTAALTGESKPDSIKKGEVVLAGMINLNTLSLVQVTTAFQDSKLSKIVELVQNAASQKAPTELFIRKFAKIYTPIVVFLAMGICLLPYFFLDNYIFNEWLYRALIFLVISCPCALVISIPLGYFGGIGAASRHGILVKGGNFLDIMASVKNVVMDKTGTLTKGVFKVQEVNLKPEFDGKKILEYVNALESKSSHPVATAVREFVGEINKHLVLKDVEEIAGHGLKAQIEGQEILVGNFKLLDKFGVAYDADSTGIALTVIAVALDQKYVGCLTIADETKEEAQIAVSELHRLGVKTTMLSGDKTAVVRLVANKLGIDNAYGDLLPEDKVDKIKALKATNTTVAFVGDGVNDAPVVALSDAGIAMGGLGSDATIETADIVIQDDNPAKIPMVIKIGRATKNIVWQNITLAFGVKFIVLILGAGGLATLWEAVFADVGVALLAVLNSVRIQRLRY